MKKLFLLGVLMISACATVKPVYVRDGVQVYSATCNGMVRDISDCYALAAQQCAGNFEVINTVENQYDDFFENDNQIKKTVYSDNTKTVYKSNNGIPSFKTPLIKRSLFFYCK